MYKAIQHSNQPLARLSFARGKKWHVIFNCIFAKCMRCVLLFFCKLQLPLPQILVVCRARSYISPTPRYQLFCPQDLVVVQGWHKKKLLTVFKHHQTDCWLIAHPNLFHIIFHPYSIFQNDARTLSLIEWILFTPFNLVVISALRRLSYRRRVAINQRQSNRACAMKITKFQFWECYGIKHYRVC